MDANLHQTRHEYCHSPTWDRVHLQSREPPYQLSMSDSPTSGQVVRNHGIVVVHIVTAMPRREALLSVSSIEFVISTMSGARSFDNPMP